MPENPDSSEEPKGNTSSENTELEESAEKESTTPDSAPKDPPVTDPEQKAPSTPIVPNQPPAKDVVFPPTDRNVGEHDETNTGFTPVLLCGIIAACCIGGVVAVSRKAKRK